MGQLLLVVNPPVHQDSSQPMGYMIGRKESRHRLFPRPVDFDIPLIILFICIHKSSSILITYFPVYFITFYSYSQ